MSSWRRVCSAGIVLVALACGEAVGPIVEEDSRPDVSEWVTGDAALALDSEGRFTVQALRSYVEPRGITPHRAEELAEAYGRGLRFAPPRSDVRAPAQEAYGTIDWAEVSVDPGSAVFAVSPYELLPEGAVPERPELREWVDAFYHVPVMYGRYQVLLVTVPIESGDLRINEHGIPEGPVGMGTGIGVHPMPMAGDVSVYPQSVEGIVKWVGEASGALVSAVPRRILLSSSFNDAYGFWELQLDREVPTWTAEGIVWADTVYVGIWPMDGSLGRQLFVAAAEQPTLDPRFGEYGVTRKQDVPLDFETAAWPQG